MDVATRQIQRALRRYPTDASQFATMEGIEQVIEAHLLPEFIPPAPIIGKTSRVRAQGSCFARNVAAALDEQGVSVRCTNLPESVNSPLANKLFFDYVLDPEKPYAHPLHERLIAPSLRLKNREKFALDDVFVLTVGLAYSWYDRNGVPSIAVEANEVDEYEHHLDGCAANAEHLRAIISSLRQINPAIKIVLTLSPVPLHSVFTGRSAITCDTVSKSTLRIAIDEYFKSPDRDVYYWPAFEIARSLAMHTAPTFGTDDNAPRHVNKDVVAMIVRLFLRHFAKL